MLMQATCPPTYTFSKIIYKCPQKTQITLITSPVSQPLIAKTSSTSLTHEYEIQQQLSHKYLLRSHQILSNASQQTLILDYCEHGDLAKIVEKHKILPLEFTRGVLLMLIEGLKYMHENNLCHRDIKPQNILINGAGIVQICDFAETEDVSKELTSVVGTKSFMAPEVIQNSICCIKYPYDGIFVDVFSLGVVLFWMVFLQLPFQCALPRDKSYRLIQNKEFEQFWSQIEQQSLTKLPKAEEFEEIKELIQHMLKSNANERPSIIDIANSKFMSRKAMNQKEIAQFLIGQK